MKRIIPLFIECKECSGAAGMAESDPERKRQGCMIDLYPIRQCCIRAGYNRLWETQVIVPVDVCSIYIRYHVMKQHDWESRNARLITLPAKHSYMRDYQECVTTGQMPDKVIPMCRYDSQMTQKTGVFVKHQMPRRQQSQKLPISSIKVTVKVTRSLTLVSFDRVLLVEYACQIWSLYLLRFKSYGQC